MYNLVVGTKEKEEEENVDKILHFNNKAQGGKEKKKFASIARWNENLIKN